MVFRAQTNSICISPLHLFRVLDWIEQGLTSPPTQYRLSGRQFYRSKDPTNSIKVLKEKLASHRPEETPSPPGASHRVTSESLKKNHHSGSSPARQSPTQQAGLYKTCIELQIVQQQMLHNTSVRQDLGYCTLFAPSQRMGGAFCGSVLPRPLRFSTTYLFCGRSGTAVAVLQ